MKVVLQDRLEWLDALKGLAILWVVGFHVNVLTGHIITFHGYQTGSLAQLLPAFPSAGGWGSALTGVIHSFLSLGYQGAHLFLVASGFSLAFAIARNNQKIVYKKWVVRHLLHLLPLYWAAHLLFWAACYLRHDWSSMPLNFGAIASVLTLNWVAPKWFWYGPDAWWFVRLLVQLYLLFPVLYFVRMRLGARSFLVVCGAVTIACRAVSIFVVDGSHSFLLNFGFAGNRLFEFALGIAIGVAAAQGRSLFSSSWLSLPGLAACWGGGIILSTNIYGKLVSEALIATGCFGVLSVFLASLKGRNYLPRALSTVGRHSYGLYLVHCPLILPLLVLSRRYSLKPFIASVTAFVVVVVAGCIYDFLAKGAYVRAVRYFRPEAN